MKNIKPTANGEPQEVKVRVRINPNGVILVTSANLVDKKKAEEMNVENGNDANNMEVTQDVSFNLFIHPIAIQSPYVHIDSIVCHVGRHTTTQIAIHQKKTKKYIGFGCSHSYCCCCGSFILHLAFCCSICDIIDLFSFCFWLPIDFDVLLPAIV